MTHVGKRSAFIALRLVISCAVIFFFLLSASGSALAAPKTLVSNRVQDPGFEEGYPWPAWTQSSTNYSTPLCSTGDSACVSGITGGLTDSRSGYGWGWLGGTTNNETASVSQAVIFPTQSAFLKFFLRITAAAGAGTDDYFTANIDGTEVFRVDASQASLYASYREVVVDAHNYANGAAHTISFTSVTSGQVVNFSLDDVSVDDIRQFVYFPYVNRPELTNFYINNQTGGRFCIEVFETGIGQKCFDGGLYLYGSFPPGTYTYTATSTNCSSLTTTFTFSAGDVARRYSCVASSSSLTGAMPPASLQVQPTP